MDERVGDDPPALLWIAWARGYVEKLDPLNEPPEMPKDAEMTAEWLRRFL